MRLNVVSYVNSEITVVWIFKAAAVLVVAKTMIRAPNVKSGVNTPHYVLYQQEVSMILIF